MPAYPRRLVVEGLLGAYRQTVEAEQEGRRGGRAATSHNPLVEGRKQQLAGGGERDDGLNRCVVLRPRVKQFPNGGKQLGRRPLVVTSGVDSGHDAAVARVRVLAPAA